MTTGPAGAVELGDGPGDGVEAGAGVGLALAAALSDRSADLVITATWPGFMTFT
jgi:hypothetical protein